MFAGQPLASHTAARERPRVFISSVWRGLGDVRTRIYEWAIDAGYEPWLFEKAKPQAAWAALKAPEIEAICLDNVASADLYVGIFHTGYGSSATYHFAHVSFVDLEFFEALDAGVPMRLYVLEPFTPEPELRLLIQVIRTLLPNSIKSCQTEAALLDAIKRDVDRHFGRARAMSARTPAQHLKRYLRRLILTRRFHDDKDTGLRFLLDQYPSPSLPFDPDLVRSGLASVRALDSYGVQLNGAWILLQRLFHVPWLKHREYLKLWDDVLGVWDRAAAWYGLHGFTFIGKLAADNTMLAVRALLASRGETDSLKRLLAAGSEKTGAVEEWINLYGLGGALASEYYSIAKQAPNTALRRHYLLKADSWIEVAERTSVMEWNLRWQAGLAAIRGHILLELGETPRAVDIFERNLRLREEAGLGPSSIGEAKVDLGYAYFLSGRRRDAEPFLLHGLDELKREAAPGFIARAQKKLAKFYASRGALRKAAEQLVEARDLCERHGIRDQLRDHCCPR
jgi:tetratricopeptide (TPR) repeat protein